MVKMTQYQIDSARERFRDGVNPERATGKKSIKIAEGTYNDLKHYARKGETMDQALIRLMLTVEELLKKVRYFTHSEEYREWKQAHAKSQ